MAELSANIAKKAALSRGPFLQGGVLNLQPKFHKWVLKKISNIRKWVTEKKERGSDFFKGRDAAFT